MDKELVNKILKIKIGFSEDLEIEEYRKIYLNIINKASEEDFYHSMVNWFFDGNAPYYENWLKKNWSDSCE